MQQLLLLATHLEASSTINIKWGSMLSKATNYQLIVVLQIQLCQLIHTPALSMHAECQRWQLWKTGWNAANAKNGIITTPACVNIRAAALTKSAVWHCMQCLALRKPSINNEHSHASNTNLYASIILFPDRNSVHYTYSNCAVKLSIVKVLSTTSAFLNVIMKLRGSWAVTLVLTTSPGIEQRLFRWVWSVIRPRPYLWRLEGGGSKCLRHKA